VVFDDVLAGPAPSVLPAEAVEIAADLFGVTAGAIAMDGERDANFRLVADEGDFSLKVANPAERRTVVEMQQLALEHIFAVAPDLQVPRPIRTRDNCLVGTVEIDDRTCAVRLLTFLSGRAIPDAFSTPLLRSRFGSLLARLDLALRDFQHPEQERDYLWDIKQMAGIRAHADHLTEDRFEFVALWLERFSGEIEPRLAGLPHQVIHSDFNHENVLVANADPESITGVIDFADLIRSPRVIDPAVAAAYHCLGVDDPTVVVADVVGAYHEVFALSDVEIDLVADLVLARLVQSITIGAWRADLHPENREYILIHSESAWSAVRALSKLQPGVLSGAVRAACEPA